jgi:ribosomal-protein-alanine acetyltransferase
MSAESKPRLDETPFKVRPYQPSDSQALYNISRQSPESAQWSKESYDQAHSLGQIVLVAESNAEVCGFLVARTTWDEAEILNMAVEPTHRRNGIGSALLSAAISSAQIHQAKTIYLEVRESNRAAIAFYAKHGFAKSAVRRAYYSSPTENAVVMKKLTA